MAKTLQYIVSLDPASKTKYGYEIKFSLRDPGPRVRFEASSVPEVLQKVEQFANEYGSGCSAYVRLANPNERKPAGFKAAVSNLYYNLETQPEA